MISLNLVIADDDIYFCKSILNNILSKNPELKLQKIATDGEEVLRLLKSGLTDILILDLNMPYYTGIEILEILENTLAPNMPYVIIISGDNSMIAELYKKPIVYEFITKGQLHFIEKLNEVISKIIHEFHCSDIEKLIIDELRNIGFNLKHNGTTYILEAIMYMYKLHNGALTSNLEKNIYPLIARKYNTTTHNVKSNISKAINFMYYETEISKVVDYFYLSSDIKPTPKLVINSILDKVLYEIEW